MRGAKYKLMAALFRAYILIYPRRYKILALIAVIAVGGAFWLAGGGRLVRGPARAEFEVLGLAGPSEVKAGENFTILAEIKNVGDARGEFKGLLLEAGGTRGYKGLVLEPGEKGTIRYGTIEYEWGKHTYSLDGRELTLTVAGTTPLHVPEVGTRVVYDYWFEGEKSLLYAEVADVGGETYRVDVEFKPPIELGIPVIENGHIWYDSSTGYEAKSEFWGKLFGEYFHVVNLYWWEFSEPLWPYELGKSWETDVTIWQDYESGALYFGIPIHGGGRFVYSYVERVAEPSYEGVVWGNCFKVVREDRRTGEVVEYWLHSASMNAKFKDIVLDPMAVGTRTLDNMEINLGETLAWQAKE